MMASGNYRDPVEDRLKALRNILGDEAAEDALRFYPTPERETEAERDERERREAERTAEAKTSMETRDEILAGKYSADAKAKLTAAIAEHNDGNAPVVLRLASELAAKERKADYYRKLNASKKNAP